MMPGLVRQLPKLEAVDLGEQFGTAGAEFAHLPGVELDNKGAKRGIQLCEG
jgi:hypothetical protein